MKKIPQLKIEIRSQASTPNTSIIDIDGEIGSGSWDGEEYTWNTSEAIKKKLREVEQIKSDHIIVNIHSLGGYINDGLAIHDVLAMHPATIETRVIGLTASAATIIAQAGDVRKMSENALYLIHRSWGFTVGNAFDHLEVVEQLESIDKRMLSIYANRSGKSESEIISLMDEAHGAGKWIDHTEALAMGLIDESFQPMQAAAAVLSPAKLLALGLPIPEKQSHTEPEKEIIAQIEADKLKLEEENETECGEQMVSGEVVPEGISHYEAQVKVNTNYI